MLSQHANCSGYFAILPPVCGLVASVGYCRKANHGYTLVATSSEETLSTFFPICDFTTRALADKVAS